MSKEKNKSWFDDHVIVMADSKEQETKLKNDLVTRGFSRGCICLLHD